MAKYVEYSQQVFTYIQSLKMFMCAIRTNTNYAVLSRLNGMKVNGHRLIAQPAPIFPPAVLQALWSKPDERNHVKSVLRRLLLNTELPVELSNLATKYHGDIYLE